MFSCDTSCGTGLGGYESHGRGLIGVWGVVGARGVFIVSQGSSGVRGVFIGSQGVRGVFYWSQGVRRVFIVSQGVRGVFYLSQESLHWESLLGV